MTRTSFYGRTGLAALGALCVAGWMLRSELKQDSDTAIAGWAEGTSVRYRLAWQMDTELSMPGQGSFAGHVDLGGTLQLVSHGDHDGKTLIAASLASVDAHDVQVLGKPVFETEAAAEAALIGSTAWVELAPDGAIAGIAFERGASPAFKHVMQSLVGLATITPNAGDAWTAIEPGPSGIAEVRYERDGAQLTRVRDRYQKLTVAPASANASPVLTAKAEIELDRSGRIAKLVDDEELAIATDKERLYHGHSHFTLTLEGTEVLASVPARPALDTLETRLPGVPAVGGDVDRGHLEQRVGQLTFDGLVRGLSQSWSDREAKRAWFSQAVALLRLDPALCNELVEIAFAHTASDRARLLVMDLLASTGHGEAQTAMREALGRPTARAEQVALVQRFSMVARPTAASAKFLIETHAAANDRDFRIATAYTLGAVADHLRSTDAALSRDVTTTLRQALVKADSNADRAELLSALGNAASNADAELVIGYTSSEDRDVRRRAAWALRDLEAPSARDALLGLVADADADVARTSLEALSHQSLAAADLERLEQAAIQTDAARAGLVDLLAHQSASPAVRRMLEAIRETSNDPNLQERARVVLAQLN